MDFKECLECSLKPGSPVLCEQCLWVREHYPMRTTEKINRVEVIDHTHGGEGRAFVKWRDDIVVELDLQDELDDPDGKTFFNVCTKCGNPCYLLT